MAEASGVVELDDEAVLQFIERNGAATTPWGRQGVT
jgi:hypothetical protein